MASLISGSTALNIAENENSSMDGNLSVLAAKPTDSAEGFGAWEGEEEEEEEEEPFMVKKRGEGRLEAGPRGLWRTPE